MRHRLSNSTISKPFQKRSRFANLFKVSKRPFSIKQTTQHQNYYRNFTIACGAFLLAFIAASLFAPVSPSSATSTELARISSGSTYVSVTGSDIINLNIGQPSTSGKLVKTSDSLTIATNASAGYKLYVSMDNALADGNRLYKNGDDTSAFLSPNKSSGQDVSLGSETALADNSWGFTTDATKYNNGQFAAMPLSNNLALISQRSTTGTSTQNIYYGANANTMMSGGTYSGNIVYTVTSDAIPTNSIKSITPDTVLTAGGESINITVKLFSSSITDPSQLGTITTTIAGTTCPITNTTISSDNLVITCTTPAIATEGAKTLTVSIERYGQTCEGEITYEVPVDPMQSFTALDCANLATSTSSSPVTVVLKDTRDNTKYRVSKLADGNCWMVDNLALDGTTDGTTPRTLTTSDSDITSNYTFPSGVDISVGTSAVDTTPQIVTGDKEKTDNGIKYGNYYNFLAATAGWGTTSISSGDSPQSICPKGWKLPAYSGDKSYYDLLTTNYGVTSSNVWTTVRNAPLYFPAAGNYYSSGSFQGSRGSYWSRRVNNANVAHSLYFYSGYYNPQNSNYKSFGFSVRCVFDPPTMQDFTAQDCANLTTSTSSVDNRKILRDTRDNTYYNIAKLADGNCWMVDNLALDGTTDGTTPRTLTPSDSDVTSNYTFPSGVDITVGTSSAYSPAQIVTRDKNKTDNGNKYGNYYNFLAATAGWGTTSISSGDSPQSICSKGWKLPAYSGDKSYYDLLTTNYGVTSSNVWTTVRNAPLYFPAAGNYYSGVNYQGNGGYYWSRRVYETNLACHLRFDNGVYYPQRNYSKGYGFSVRCVFGG